MENLGHVDLGRGKEVDAPVVIAQFTDLHQWPKGVKSFEARGRVIDFDKENYSTEKNVELLEHVVNVVKPDFAVLTGDIIDGRPCKDMDKEKFKEVMLDVVQPLIDAKIKWTFCPGNHDDDHSPWTRQEMMEIFQLPYCVSAPATSYDHTFTIGHGAEPDSKYSVRLWMFDSGENSDDEKIRYTTFSPEAVEGYRALSKSSTLAPSGVGLAFFHIPLPEYEGLVPLVGKNGLFDAALKGGKVPFPFNHQPFTSLVRLLKKDLVAGCSRLNSGIFQAFSEEGNVLATFCGHDHHSDFVAKRENVYLCYGRCGGHTPPHDWEKAGGGFMFDHGARVIECKGGKQVSTYCCTFNTDREDEFDF